MTRAEIERWFELIWHEKSQNLKPARNPKIFLLAGQPGCGKTALRYQTQHDFGQDVIVVNSDELR